MSVSLDINEDIALIALDDGKANAISPDVLDALERALDEAEGKAKAVVFAGRPGKFCAGFDLKVVNSEDPAQRASLMHRGGQILHRIYVSPKPIVAAATGHALAFGALWLLVCDTRIGATGAFKYGLNETAIGIPLPAYGIEIARAQLHPGHLTAAVVQSHIYDPEGAIAMGFLDMTVDADALIATAMQTAGQLGALPGAAYSANKLAIRQVNSARIASSLEDGPTP